MEPEPPAPLPDRATTGWLWLAALPFGFGSWVPLVAGVRARHAGWALLGALLAVATIVSLALPEAEDGGITDAAGILATGAWIAGVGWTLSCREAYARRAGAHDLRAARDFAVDLREGERARALEQAAADPLAALRRGVGRPDLPGADHGWVVDLNHAPAAALQGLPGVDAVLARRIVATREQVGRFSSVDDMAFVLDLPSDVVGPLRGLVVAIEA